MAAAKINDQRGRRERQERGGEGGGECLNQHVQVSQCFSRGGREGLHQCVLCPLWGSRVLSERHVTLIDLANLFDSFT